MVLANTRGNSKYEKLQMPQAALNNLKAAAVSKYNGPRPTVN